MRPEHLERGGLKPEEATAMTSEDEERAIMEQAAAAHARISREREGLRSRLGEACAEITAKDKLIEELKRVSAEMLAEIKHVHSDEHDRMRLALIDEQVRVEGLRHDLDQTRADLSDLQALFGSIRVGVEQFEMRAPIKRRNGNARKRHTVVVPAGDAEPCELPEPPASANDVADLPPFLAREK
jgi:hypothetical protein